MSYVWFWWVVFDRSVTLKYSKRLGTNCYTQRFRIERVSAADRQLSRIKTLPCTNTGHSSASFPRSRDCTVVLIRKSSRYAVNTTLYQLVLDCFHFYIGFRHQTWRNLKATSSLLSAAPTFWYPACCSPESLGSKGSRTWTRFFISHKLRNTAMGNSTR